MENQDVFLARRYATWILWRQAKRRLATAFCFFFAEQRTRIKRLTGWAGQGLGAKLNA
ncbi:MAG: hypothetical protein WB821_11815 [Burkholderiaceae bacterium]